MHASSMARHSKRENNNNYRSILNHRIYLQEFFRTVMEGNNDKFVCPGSALNLISHFDNQFLAVEIGKCIPKLNVKSLTMTAIHNKVGQNWTESVSLH